MYELASYCTNWHPNTSVGFLNFMNSHFPLGDINPIKYFYLVASVTGVLFALIAPVENIPFLLHLFIWQLQAFIPISLIIVAHISLLKAQVFSKQRQWVQLLVSGITGSFAFAPAALAIDIYIVGEGFPTEFWYELGDEAAAVIPPVTVFWMLINLPWLAGLEYQKKNNTEPENQTPTGESEKPLHQLPEFLLNTPITRLSDVVSLSAQLHYLEVATRDKKYLVLYSLAKAIDELPEELGIQTHRSHWVATQYITDIKKLGRQGEAILTNNTAIPISRAKFNDVYRAFVQLDG